MSLKVTDLTHGLYPSFSLCCVELRWSKQVLKLYAWEDSFKERVLDIRGDELQSLKKAAYLNAVSALSWFMAPYLVGFPSWP